MNDLDLEDRLTTSLRRGAGSAPLATGAVRQHVRRRSHTLRRRQGAVQALSVAAVASLAAGTGMWLRGDGRGSTDPTSTLDEPYMDPPHRGAWPDPPVGDGTLPTFTIDGFQLDPGTVAPGSHSMGSTDEPQPALGSQVFREAGNWSGPVVGVEHKVCDNCDGLESGLPPAAGADHVTVNGQDARLWRIAPDGRILTWDLPDDGGRVLAISRDLTTAELLQFAEGLERTGSLGFTAHEHPQGIVEDTVRAVPQDYGDRRIDELRRGDVEVNAFVELVDARLMAEWSGPFSSNMYVDTAEHVTVMGRPALLLHHDDSPAGRSEAMGPYWELSWRQRDDVVVVLTIEGASRADVLQVIDGIRET